MKNLKANLSVYSVKLSLFFKIICLFSTCSEVFSVEDSQLKKSSFYVSAYPMAMEWFNKDHSQSFPLNNPQHLKMVAALEKVYSLKDYFFFVFNQANLISKDVDSLKAYTEVSFSHLEERWSKKVLAELDMDLVNDLVASKQIFYAPDWNSVKKNTYRYLWQSDFSHQWDSSYIIVDNFNIEKFSKFYFKFMTSKPSSNKTSEDQGENISSLILDQSNIENIVQGCVESITDDSPTSYPVHKYDLTSERCSSSVIAELRKLGIASISQQMQEMGPYSSFGRKHTVTFHLKDGYWDDTQYIRKELKKIKHLDFLNQMNGNKERAGFRIGEVRAQLELVDFDADFGPFQILFRNDEDGAVKSFIGEENNGFIFKLKLGWGDCSSGCVDRHFWLIAVVEDGRNPQEFDRSMLFEYGSPLPECLGNMDIKNNSDDDPAYKLCQMMML